MAINKTFVAHTELKAQDLNDLVDQANAEIQRLDSKGADQIPYKNGSIADAFSIEKLQSLTPSTTGALGYVPKTGNSVGNAISFGSFSYHDIYTIEEGKKYEIEVEYPGGDDYAFVVTDANDVILQIVSSETIFGSETSGTKTYAFNVLPNQAKLYISAVSNKVHNCYEVHNKEISEVVEELSEEVDGLSGNVTTLSGDLNAFLNEANVINNNVYRRLAFLESECPTLKRKGSTGTQVTASSNNSCLKIKNSTFPKILSYETGEVTGCLLYDIAGTEGNGFRYIYISEIYNVTHARLSDYWVNFVMLDTNDNVIKVGVIATNILRVPKNARVLLAGRNTSVVYDSCEVEEIYDVLNAKIDEQIEDLQEDLNVTTPTLLQPSTTGASGYVPKTGNSVGNAISFGSFSYHDVYTIEANKKYQVEIEYPGGNDYAYAITDANDIILQIIDSGTIFGEETSGTKTYTFNVLPNQAKLYISAVSNKVHNCYEVQNKNISDIVEELSEAIEPMKNDAIAYFGTKDFNCDGDSMTWNGGWPSRVNTRLHFKTTNNNSCGNAKCCDRTSSTSGTTYYPQWAPDCTEQEPFIDYMGLSDPNYAEGGEGIYTSGTQEFDQATANNCIYGHLGRLIKMVNDGVYPTPQIFIMNIMGVNDTWGTGSIDATIGTFDDAITGSYDQLQRNTILKSIRWFVTKFRITFPQCKLFWKTSTQQTAENHLNFYKIEEPILQLLRYLSVPIIDSYAEVGIMRELEHSVNDKRSQNQWTSDGTHPTSAGYQMDGDFVASQLKSWFSALFY